MRNTQYEVRNEVITGEELQTAARVMICQLKLEDLDYEKVDDLLIIKNNSKLKAEVDRMLSIARMNEVDLMVFPECSIPEGMIEYLYKFATSNNIYIIGGSHYKKGEEKYKSICPIITPHTVYYINKINVAPAEDSPYRTKGLEGGDGTKTFINSRFGNFAVTICADLLDEELKQKLNVEHLSLLIVPAMNNATEEFYDRMNLDVNSSQHGMYVIYTNFLARELSNGKSAVFGMMHQDMRQKLVEGGAADEKPQNLLYRLKDNQRFLIFDLDLENKRPYKKRNLYTECNFRIWDEDKEENGGNYQFLDLIKTGDIRYRNIDKYYVLPAEYDDIKKMIEENHVALIIGDPGIGKTYTAVRLLWEYYKEGYKPKWFYGMDKNDRELQSQQLQDYDPVDKEIVYFEDPFGRSKFERKEDLAEILKPLLSRIKNHNSRIIITSRSAVFEEFSAETLDAEGLRKYSKEMNIVKPSYSLEKLIEIAEVYIDSMANWCNNEAMKSIIIKAIKEKQLVTPLAIFDVIKNCQYADTDDVLNQAVNEVKSDDVTVRFSFEVQNMQIPSKVLLYMIFFLGNIHIRNYQTIYSESLLRLRKMGKMFDITHYTTEMQQMLGRRIQKIGDVCPAYRFLHPIYEEVMEKLFLNDKQCMTIAKEVFSQIYDDNNGLGIRVLNYLIVKYPDVALSIYEHLQSTKGSQMKDYLLLRLALKMLFSRKPEFEEESRKLLKIDDLLTSLYEDEDLKLLFYEKIRMLYRRFDEVRKSGVDVDWCRIFTVARMKRINPTMLVNSLHYVRNLDKEAVVKVVEQLARVDVWRLYLLMPSDMQREKFNRILTDSKYKDVYQQLRDRIPNLSDLKDKKFKYFDVLKEHVIDQEDVAGVVKVDKKAFEAMKAGVNLYPVGVEELEGDFYIGDVIRLVCPGDEQEYLCVTELTSEFLKEYKGMKTEEIMEKTGEMNVPVVARKRNRFLV